MKKIMVIALGLLSNGEITISMGVLRRLLGKEAEICYVIHKNMCQQVVANGFSVIVLEEHTFSENRELFRRELKKFSPDLIICADTFTMDFASPWSGIDLDELKSIGIPVGSFDQYEWEATNYLQDFSGVPMKLKSELISECDFIIRPCPVNKPTVESKMTIVNCSLFDMDTLLAEKEANVKNIQPWRKSKEILKESKIILIVNSPWEYLDVARSLDTARLINWLPRIIYNYLSMLDIPITVFHIGGREWPLTDNRLIDYRHFMRVEPAEYNRLIHCADLFCGTNLISVTLSTAVLCKTPAVLFQNEKYIDFTKLSSVLERMPDWYREMALDVVRVLPFKVFPWGWFRFLKPIMNDNPYSQTFAALPIFEPKKCVKMLYDSLYDGDYINNMQERQEQYADMIRLLPSPTRVLELIV